MRDSGPSFHLVVVCLDHTERALRQHRRALRAFEAAMATRRDLGFERGNVPEPLVRAERAFDDAMVFTILAARQAVRARHELDRRGVELPELRQAERVWALRDLHEHWPEWNTERHNILDRPWARSSVGRRWDRVAPQDRPHGGHGYFETEDGRTVLTDWSGIKVRRLRRDLRGLRAALRDLRREAFEWELPTVAAAGELVGAETLRTIREYRVALPMQAADGQLRYDLPELLQAAWIARDLWMPDRGKGEPELPEEYRPD